jgi:hypothetical protein
MQSVQVRSFRPARAAAGALGLAAVVAAAAPTLGAEPAALAVARYGIADWPEAGRGNHRAVLQVKGKADAVRVLIPWRRRDSAPEKKALRVFDGATGKAIDNVVAVAITREAGEIAFQPASGPGTYEVYHLPYEPPKNNFDAVGEYFPPQDTADPAWRTRHGLAAEALAQGAWRSLPEAELVEIQARGEFHRFDPMEVIATAAETEALLALFPQAPYLLFPEDRRSPIRMTHDLPAKWVQEGPRETFAGSAQPNEYYVFQVGVWAARQAIPSLAVEFTGLTADGKPAIPAAAMTCFNLGGTDWLGRRLVRTVSVAQGTVQALWFGVQVPRDAAGVYRGSLTVRPEGAEVRRVSLELRVEGELLADSGDGELWRMARLRWLNSSLGLDDEVVPPYTPIQVAGDTLRILGRSATFGSVGLPASIVSNGREILAAPLAFIAETEGGAVAWTAGGTEMLKQAPATVERRTGVAGAGLGLTVDSRTEADGCLTFRVTVRASRDTPLRDIRVELPLRREVTTYLMGMGRRGGLRPPEWKWAWDVNRADNMVWIGDADAGVQLKLMGPTDTWDTLSLKDSGLPASWSNGGQGGCTIAEAGDTVLVRVTSGKRTLEAREELEFRFRLLVTPFKPIDPNHWNWRYGGFEAGGNVLHLHHGTWENPYINYPFLTADRVKALVQKTQASRVQRVDLGELSYPAAGNVRTDRGALHVWARVLFDPTIVAPQQAIFNRALFGLEFANQDEVGFYWNIDDHGMRAYVRQGAPEQNRYPVVIPSGSPDWREGQRHVLTLSWGDRFEIYVDGKRTNAADYRGLLATPLTEARMLFRGGFALDAVRITSEPYREGETATPVADEHTLFLDTFSAVAGKTTKPERAAAGTVGTFVGTIETPAGAQGSEVVFSGREVDTGPKGLNLYYTVRELSNHVAEMWALRSLGDEVLRTTTQDSMKVGDTDFGVGGGYAWLREHLGSDYVVGWRQPLWEGDLDAAIQMQGLSRWHNYYLEGLNWLMRNTGMDGLYLDGIGYDREIMKRVAKIMVRANPDCRSNFHGGDGFSAPWDPDRRVSTANANLEHLPYISNLWFGELFDYDRAPDYWLVEISGIPFGLTGEMLNYENGGNPYRGMIYGMSGRQHPSAPAMWRFWDEFAIRDAEMLGYWDRRCPAKTNIPGVLATVYRRPGSAAIALAHWPSDEVPLPVAVVAAVPRPPAVDGTLTPGEWDAAAGLVRLNRFGQDVPPDLPCEVFITHDPERLYIGWRCATGGATPKATATTRDGATYEDDAMELFLQPDPKVPKYCQFVGNSRGAFLDGQGQDASWNGPWEYRASVQADSWQGEASIPFAAIGVRSPAPGTAIGFNACRDQQAPRHELCSWAPVRGSFHDPQHFGSLRLAAAAPTREEPVTAEERLREAVAVTLAVDWQALGLNPERVRLVAPVIRGFQPAAEFAVDAVIPVERAKGWLLVASEVAPKP